MSALRELRWRTPLGALWARVATAADLAVHAPALARAYSDPANMRLLGHIGTLTVEDVLEHYARLDDEHGNGLLLFRDGALAGDADIRGVTMHGAELVGEFAFLIGAPKEQGKGLGTAFAIMVHTFAFRDAGLARLYASILPDNNASRRVFEKLGYHVDAGDHGIGDEGDVVMSIDAATFLHQHAAAVADIHLDLRD